MNTLQPHINHFQPWNDDGEGYKFGDFVNPTPKPAAQTEPQDRVQLSIKPPPVTANSVAFLPWTDPGEGYTFKGFV